MSQCPDCGTRTSPEHKFCLNCGRELEDAEPSIVPPAVSHLPEDVEPRGDPVAPAHAEAAIPAASSETGGAPPGSQPPDAVRPHPVPPVAPPQLPRRIGAGAAIPAVVALVSSFLFQEAISTVIPPDAYVTRLFRPSGGWLMGVIPALIGFALVWTLTDLALKLRIAVINERDFRRPEVRHLPTYMAKGASDVALQRLRTWDRQARGRPVARRVAWILQHLEATEPGRAHELIRHQSDLEADQTASAYRTVKLFIWAMPILGFIGTVLGISLAVGGFSEFLTTSVSIDQIDAVTAELGEVASGLSFAFDTTLLGLLGGLLASVVSSAVQAREERLLTRLEEFGLRILETGAPVAAHEEREARAASAQLEELMRERLRELSTQMDRFAEAVGASFDGFLEQLSTLPAEVERIGAELGGLREHLRAATEGSEGIVAESRALLDGLGESSSALTERINAAVSSLDERARGLGDQVEEISDRLSGSLTGLTERLAHSDGRLQAAVEGLTQAVERNHDEGLGDRLAALTESLSAGMSALTERLAASDDRLRIAMEGLAEAVEGSIAGGQARAAVEQTLSELSKSIGDLRTTLEAMREAQAALGPLVSKLSGPLELRLVPPAEGTRAG